MSGSTAGSRVALSPEQRRRQATRWNRWTPEGRRDAGSYWQARILGTAVHLELFDWLGKGAKSPRAAAGHFGGAQQGWKIFFDALSAMGLLRKRAASYQNSSFALGHLCSGKGSFLLSDHDGWGLWGRLPDFLTSGKRPKIVRPFFTDRRQTARLLRSLDHDARKIAPYLMKRLPLGSSKTLLRCRRRSRQLHFCVLPPISPSSSDDRGTPQGGATYPPCGAKGKGRTSGAGRRSRYRERSLAARIRLGANLQCAS